jgi:hypothetical protein
MPDAPPDTLEDWEVLRARALGLPAGTRESAVEVRLGDGYDFDDPSKTYEPRQRNWIRVKGPLPDDPVVHVAVLVYLTDRTLLSTAVRAHGLPWGKRMAASLDHAVWIHRDRARVVHARREPDALRVGESGRARRARLDLAVSTPARRAIASVAQRADPTPALSNGARMSAAAQRGSRSRSRSHSTSNSTMGCSQRRFERHGSCEENVQREPVVSSPGVDARPRRRCPAAAPVSVFRAPANAASRIASCRRRAYRRTRMRGQRRCRETSATTLLSVTAPARRNHQPPDLAPHRDRGVGSR